jgi:hypothetical protein
MELSMANVKKRCPLGLLIPCSMLSHAREAEEARTGKKPDFDWDAAKAGDGT